MFSAAGNDDGNDKNAMILPVPVENVIAVCRKFEYTCEKHIRSIFSNAFLRGVDLFLTGT